MITIRKATERDVDFIVKFNEAMAYETEDKVLDKTTLTKGVVNLMKHPEFGFYLIAEFDGKVAGSLMITTEWSDWRDGLFWWIQSVYVSPDFRRKGIYRKLYEYVKELAAEDKLVCGYRLYVEKENKTAQKTYEILGMTITDYLLYEELK